MTRESRDKLFARAEEPEWLETKGRVHLIFKNKLMDWSIKGGSPESIKNFCVQNRPKNSPLKDKYFQILSKISNFIGPVH